MYQAYVARLFIERNYFRPQEELINIGKTKSELDESELDESELIWTLHNFSSVNEALRLLLLLGYMEYVTTLSQHISESWPIVLNCYPPYIVNRVLSILLIQPSILPD